MLKNHRPTLMSAVSRNWRLHGVSQKSACSDHKYVHYNHKIPQIGLQGCIIAGSLQRRWLAGSLQMFPTAAETTLSVVHKTHHKEPATVIPPYRIYRNTTPPGVVFYFSDFWA